MDVPVRITGDANRARLGKTFQPGRNVDRVAKKISAFGDHFAEVNTDSHLQGPARVSEGCLNRHRTLDCGDDTRELSNNAVARCVGDTSTVVSNEAVCRLAKFAQRFQCARFVAFSRSGIACNVSGENCCQSTTYLI